MQLSYKLEDFDKNKIVSKFGLTEGGKAELFLANTCFIRMQKYVPKDTGTLSTTATIKPGSVTYTVPYAKKQFYTNKGNGQRQARWHLPMIAKERSIITKEVESYIKQMKG